MSPPSRNAEFGVESPEKAAANSSQALYTPAMLASVLGVSLATVRSWHRRGLIRPVKVANRVPYFDFPQLATGRRLVSLIGQGISPAALQKKLKLIQRWLPGIALSELSVRLEGNDILVHRQGELLETDGQKRLDFSDVEAGEGDSPSPVAIPISLFAASLEVAQEGNEAAPDLFRLKRTAEQHEDAGDIEEAIQAWRMFLLVGGPHAEICYRLGELLYLAGDVEAARERYYVALETDPSLVEVRASLGCVLMELGETDLAIAALQGALSFEENFPDIHYHLAVALESANRNPEARQHWRRFLALAPASPWSEQARINLERLKR